VNETSPLAPQEMVRDLARYASDRKALEIVQLDLRGLISYTDFFLVCSGRTGRQVKAIHDASHQGMKSQHRLLPGRVEGLAQARWVLMDYLDVVVHIFTPDARAYYRLEQLWAEAPLERIDEGAFTVAP